MVSRFLGKLLRIDIDPDQTVVTATTRHIVAWSVDSRNAAQALLSALSHKPPAERRNHWGHARAARLREEMAATWDAPTPAQSRFLETVLHELPNAVFVGMRPRTGTATGNLDLQP